MPETANHRPMGSANRLLVFLAAITLFSRASVGAVQREGMRECFADSVESQRFYRAEVQPPDSSSPCKECVFVFTIGTTRYVVGADGRTQIVSTTNGSRTAALDLDDPDAEIEVLYYLQREESLIFLIGLTDNLYGWGRALSVNPRTLETNWATHMAGFNVGQGIVDGKYAYVTAIGFVAKLDLESGAYAWQHRDLYGKHGEGSFNSFDTPKIDRKTVLFKEHRWDRKPARLLKVDRESGEILAVVECPQR